MLYLFSLPEQKKNLVYFLIKNQQTLKNLIIIQRDNNIKLAVSFNPESMTPVTLKWTICKRMKKLYKKIVESSIKCDLYTDSIIIFQMMRRKKKILCTIFGLEIPFLGNWNVRQKFLDKKFWIYSKILMLRSHPCQTCIMRLLGVQQPIVSSFLYVK